MSVNTNFTDALIFFCRNHKTLCILTLGLAVIGFSLGNLCGRCVAWLSKIYGAAEIVDSVAQEKFNILPLFEKQTIPTKNEILSLNRKITQPDEENLTIPKSLSISSSSTLQIKTCATVELPNFTSIHINEQGEVFHLTPIGGNSIHYYNEKLDDYTKACLKISLKMDYNENGHLVHHEKIIKHSIVKKIEDLHAKEHVVNLWIQACHFIIVKSDQGRYWFLHYDPGQSKHQYNKIDGLPYSRPTYSDLRPVLPYNIDRVALQDREKIQVVVVHPSRSYNINNPNNLSNGVFDSAAFKNFVGEDKVLAIKTICYKDFIKERKDLQIEIDFNTKSETLTIYLKGQRDKPICNFENLF